MQQFWIGLSLGLCTILHLGAQPLVLDSLMLGEGFIGYSPQAPHWSPLRGRFEFVWRAPQDSTGRWYALDSKRLRPQALAQDWDFEWPTWPQARPNYPDAEAWLQDEAIYYREGSQQRLLWQGGSAKSKLRWDAQGQSLFWLEGRDWYALRLDKDWQVRQICQFEAAAHPDKKEREQSPEERYLREQQQELFEFLKEDKPAKTPKIKPQIVYLDQQQLDFSELDPTGRYLFYRCSKTDKGKPTQVPNYLDASGFTEGQNARPKVVQPAKTSYKYYWQDLETGENRLLNWDSLPGLYETWRYGSGDSIELRTSPKASALIPFEPLFSAQTGWAVMELRRGDNKARWLLALQPQSPQNWHLVDYQRDSAWLGGPGVGSWSSQKGWGAWWPDGQRYGFISEREGFAQLYSYEPKSRETRRILPAQGEIFEVWPRPNGFYYLSSEADLRQRQLYFYDWKKARSQRLSPPEAGAWEFYPSPDFSQALLRYSSATQPWELYHSPLDGDKPLKIKPITQSQKPGYAQRSWPEPEFIEVLASDGQRIPARLYRPRQAGQRPKAGVIFVHGAGYLQNAHRWWSSYQREYLFHHFLCEQGYTVLDLDYRASAGYGRDWRRAIYRHMGGRDLDDQVDGRRYLIDSLGLDSSRIGIYGGSYGGFITLMALFKHPGKFASGAALRAVTDWAHYNYHYTSNILNSPLEDPQSYRRSSPIYFAEGLADPLLIIHGLMDSNVHAQDVLRLQQRLIELRKNRWELALYPIENHAFIKDQAWQDAYSRIFQLFENTLMKAE